MSGSDARSPASLPTRFGLARFFPRNRRTLILVVLILLVVDALFIGLDFVAGEADGFPEQLHVYVEGSIPEWFQWLKFLAAAGLTYILARSTVPLYYVWTGIFLYLFADDAFMGHERVAGHAVRILHLDEIFDLPFDIWIVIEPLYMALVAGFFLVVLWYVSRRASSASSRRFTLEGLVLLAMLVGFAGAGDVIGKLVFGGTHVPEVIEDGGEMIAATLLLAHAARQIGMELGLVRGVTARRSTARDTS